MKKVFLCSFAAFALLVTVATAQMPSSQGTQRSSPTMGQPGAAGQQPGYPGQQQPGATDPGMSNDQTQNQNQNQTQQKSEKKMKGCVQSQGGQYILETKKGKAVALTGQDMSAHVGHEVTVKGTWESGAGNSSTASSGSAEKVFNVAKIDHESDTCGGKKGDTSSSTGNSGSMGPASTGSAGSGTAGGSSTSNGSSSGGSTSTQPPQ